MTPSWLTDVWNGRLARIRTAETAVPHRVQIARLRPPALTLGVLITALAGCAPKLGGAWETVDVQPPGASFPFNRVQFDPAGKYTATGLYDGSGRMTSDAHTTTGDFRQSGSQLQIQPNKGDPQVYQVRRRLDGKMEILLAAPGQPKPIKAVLVPSGN